ncbi:MAG: chorismate mutase, partial [Candidatus Methanomethylophilaceae archaeon]|nr:chorismate mutase [Candidatus Methanomethylophilaceae archaeon]
MDLEQLRKDIAEIDMQIIGLIAKRISIAEDVGRIKLSQGL